MKKVSPISGARPKSTAPRVANPTLNSIDPEVRSEVIALLQARMVDAIDLMMQCKQAHWNVKGPEFIALHELFDTVHTEVHDFADLLAERGTMLGGQMAGTVRQSAKQSSLNEYPLDLRSCTDHAKALSQAMSQFNELIRQSIAKGEELEDAVTVDILTEVSRGIEMRLWMVESHAQKA